MVVRGVEADDIALSVSEAQKVKSTSLIPLLLPYQLDVVTDDAESRVVVKSRRIGMTWALAAEAVLCAVRGAARGSDVWYLSQSKRDAKEFIRDCARFARAFNYAFRECGDAPALVDDDGSILVTAIKFASGHRITILPGKNPDAVRGKSGLVIFDEAALLNIEACREAGDALAMDMKGGRIIYISTQRGENNQFNKLVEAVKARDRAVRGFKLHSTTLPEACAKGFYRRLCMIRGLRYTGQREKDFIDRMLARPAAGQEFLCIPARDGEVFLPRDLLERAMPRRAAPITWVLPAGWELKQDEAWRREQCEIWIARELALQLARLETWDRHSIGWDFGRSARGDLSAVAIVAMSPVGPTRHVPFVIELTGVPYEQQLQILEAIVKRLPNFDGAMLDATGNGSWLAEKAQQLWGPALIEAKKFGPGTRAWYEEIMPKYKAALLALDLLLPWYPDLLADHSEFVLDDSVPVLPKKRGKSEDGQRRRHGDAALACVMAYARSLAGRGVDFSVAAAVPSGRTVTGW